MASLFPRADGTCRLLDAGAGIGTLTAAFLERWRSGEFRFSTVDVDAFEIDTSLHEELSHTLSRYCREGYSATVYGEDFIHVAVDALSGAWFAKSLPRYTHVILNPPYKKIRSDSAHRLALRRIGIETVNLYSAFVALSVALCVPGGQVVAIIPRSFCNGPYYRPFREYILERSAIRYVHLFESRNRAFKDDDVLQENIIIRLERDGSQGPVTVSISTDDTFTDFAAYEHSFDQIVARDDHERVIHLPTSPEPNTIALSPAIQWTLAKLGIDVSTGPVVDFRLKEHLRDMPGANTVPLLYPGHFTGLSTIWPIEGMKKPNAIEHNAYTAKWLYPKGFYCVVRRFSSKEERRRIVASVVDPARFPDALMLGFENHLNVFHQNRRGLPKTLAWGLAVFLNTTAVDEFFRRFSGHTQVNATDLRMLKYPSRQALVRLGEWAIEQEVLTQELIDAKAGEFFE